jgi:hypothetical protein
MTMTSIPTVPIYIRIPVTLRERLEKAAQGERSYLPKGAIADTAVKALGAGLDALASPADSDQLNLFDGADKVNGHKPKRASKPRRAHKAKRALKRTAKRTKRGRK